MTAVDSAGKLDMLSDIGADHVIDYAREDFSSNGISYDVIFDVVGKSSYSRSLNRSEEHTSELQSRRNLVCRLLLEKKKQQ